MKLSVIIPVYNVESYLERCINSILKQNYNDYEIILINDGSTDNSLSICKKYADNFSNVRLVNQKNQGSGFARNAGMKVAQGKYLYFCDPDDYLEEGFFDIVNEYIEKKPELIIFSYWDEFEKNGKPYKRQLVQIEENQYLSKTEFRDSFNELYSKYLLHTLWNKVYSSDFLKRNNIIFTDAPMGQDTRFNLSLYPLLTTVQLVKTPYYHYISNRIGSSTTKYRINRVELQLEEVKMLKETLERMDKTNEGLINKVKTDILLDNCSRITNSDISKEKKIDFINILLNKEAFETILDDNYNNERVTLNLLKNKKIKTYILLKNIQQMIT